MKFHWLINDPGGFRNIRIPLGQMHHHRLLRYFRKMPDTIVDKRPKHESYPDARAIIVFRNSIITVEEVWSDYLICCYTNTDNFDEFVDRLKNYKVRWWQWLLSNW